MLGLQRLLSPAGLPDDIAVRVNPAAADIAGTDVEAVVDEAIDDLRQHGLVLDRSGAPAPADVVRANLLELNASAQRVRTSLAGPAADLLAYHWVGPHLGGSLVRRGHEHELSLFDVRRLGAEILRLLPDPPAAANSRRAFRLPLETLAAVAAMPEPVPGLQDALGRFLEMDYADLRHWTESVQAVLHVTVPHPDPDQLPRMLVWFLGAGGWWAAQTTGDPDRLAILTPVDRGDLPAALGVLVAEAWA